NALVNEPFFLNRDRPIFGAHELAHEQRQPGPIFSIIAERLKRRETRWRAVLECQICAARRQHENLSAPVLVDEDLAGTRLFSLCHQEVDEDRLAAARWANDHRVANVPLVEA